MSAISLEQVKALVDESIRNFEDAGLRRRVKRRLLDPFVISLSHEKGPRVGVYQVWVVCKTFRTGAVVYACGGYAADGYPWGLLNTATDSVSGPISSWYRTFEDCLLDSGWFEEGVDDSEEEN